MRNSLTILALVCGLASLFSCSGQPANAPRGTPTVNISDALPTGAIAQIGTARLRSVSLQSVAVAPDGSVIITGGALSPSMTQSVAAWSLRDGKLLFAVGAGDVFVSISPDARTFATSGKYGDQEIRLWNLKSGRLVRDLPIPKAAGANGGAYGIGRTTFSPDGKLIAAESWWEDTRGKPEYPRFYAIQLVNLSTGHVNATLSIPKADQYGYGSPNVVFSPDSNSVALIGGKDRSVYIMDTANANVLSKIGTQVTACKFSADGRWLVVAEYNHLRLIDLKSGKEVRSFKGFETKHSGGPGPIALSPNQKLLAAGGGYGDPTIRVWSANTGTLLRQFPRYFRSSATSLDFTPDGKYLVCGSGKFVHVLHIEDGREDPLNATPRGELCGVFISPDGKTLALCGDDRGVRIHDVTTGRRLLWFNRGEYVRSVAFTPDGTQVATVGQTIKLWKLATGGLLRTLQENLVRVKGDAWSITSAAFLEDGKQLLTGSHFGVMQLWDVKTGQEIRHFDQPLDNDHHAARVRGLAIFPDEKRAATASDGILIWDLSTGEIIERFAGGYGNFDVNRPVAVSPDGESLAFETHLRADNSEPQIVAIQEVEGRQPLRFLQSHVPHRRDLLNVSVAYSPDGRLLATGGGDCMVHVWDVATCKEVKRFEGHQDFVSGLSFSPDGRILASASHDGTVLIWDTAPL